MKYSIGDKVWWANTDSIEKWVTCPCCCGVADNGHDREMPPTPYWCTKCSAEPSF